MFDFIAEDVAKDASEVFVPGEAHEAAGICEHSDEAAQQSAAREGVELHFDPVLLIEKPPTAAVLDFSGYGSVLEVSDHGGKGVIVGGVQVVKNGSWKLSVLFQPVDISGERGHLRAVADAVESGIGTEGSQCAGAVIAEGEEESAEWSEPALWRMGILQPSACVGKWIGFPGASPFLLNAH